MFKEPTMPSGERKSKFRNDLEDFIGKFSTAFSRQQEVVNEYPELGPEKIKNYLLKYPQELLQYQGVFKDLDLSDIMGRTGDNKFEVMLDLLGDRLLDFIILPQDPNDQGDNRAVTLLLAIRLRALVDKIAGEDKFGENAWKAFLQDIFNYADDVGMGIPSWWRFTGVKSQESMSEELSLEDIDDADRKVLAGIEEVSKEDVDLGLSDLRKLLEFRNPSKFREMLIGEDPTN